MAYRVIDPGDLSPLGDRPVDARSISDAANLENMGIRVYRAEPGEQLPLAYHQHEHQEEVFFVLDGQLSIETPEGIYVVPEGSAFAAEPRSPHRAHNPPDADADVRVLAIGAPAVDDVSTYEPA